MPSITSLSTAIALSGTEPLPVDQSGATVKATVNQVKTYVNTTPAITGGSINSTPIGATTPSTGAFTSLSASGNISSTSSSNVGSVGSAVVYLGGANAPSDAQLKYDTATRNLSVKTAAGALDMLTITSGGKVLIGTTTDDGVNALQVNGTIAPKATAATPTINVIGNAGTYAIGNTVNFSYFSGIICVFGYEGQVNQFACGGGSVTTMVAHGGGLGTLAYNPAINGYTFTFTVGVTATFHSVLGSPGA